MLPHALLRLSSLPGFALKVCLLAHGTSVSSHDCNAVLIKSSNMADMKLLACMYHRCRAWWNEFTSQPGGSCVLELQAAAASPQFVPLGKPHRQSRGAHDASRIAEQEPGGADQAHIKCRSDDRGQSCN